MVYIADDYYDGTTADTSARYKKIKAYIELAEKQGDGIYIEKPWELTIRIRLPKKVKNEPQDK